MATAGALIASAAMAEEAITAEVALRLAAPTPATEAEAMNARATQRQSAPAALRTLEGRLTLEEHDRQRAMPRRPMPHRTPRRHMPQQRIAGVNPMVAARRTAAVELPMAVAADMAAGNTSSLDLNRTRREHEAVERDSSAVSHFALCRGLKGFGLRAIRLRGCRLFGFPLLRPSIRFFAGAGLIDSLEPRMTRVLVDRDGRGAKLPKRVFVLTSPEIWGLWSQRFLKSFSVEPVVLFLPPGETHKTMRSVEKLLRQMAKAGGDRSSLLIAFGGGIVGDLEF